MNARKAIFILGSIALAFIAAVVAVALFSHKKMETEKNQAKTAPARQARLTRIANEKEQPIKESVVQEPETKDEPLTETKDVIVTE